VEVDSAKALELSAGNDSKAVDIPADEPQHVLGRVCSNGII
jgi:hypothetical protein